MARTRRFGDIYKPDFPEQAFRVCLAFAATDNQLAEFFGVSRKTIEAWKIRYPLFAQAIERGKKPADTQVAASLFMRANGFWVDTEKVFCQDGEIIRAATKEYYPPDVPAMRMWLQNRQNEFWRDRRELEIKDTRDRALDQLSDDELIERVIMKREQEKERAKLRLVSSK